jgi:hypothetical protein
MKKLEIGIPYYKAQHLYIAVEQRLLVTCKNGELVEIKPHSKYTAIRDLSVEQVCDRWNIKLKTFDHLMSKYLKPTPPVIKDRRRARHRGKDKEEYYWQKLRTMKSSNPK